MRRGLIVSIAAMVMLSMAVPAGAKKPVTEYLVTMSVADGGAGLATTCGGSEFGEPGAVEPIVMNGSLKNVLSAYGNVLTGGDLWLELVAPLRMEMGDPPNLVDVAWWREYDAGWGTASPAADGRFSGCHGQSESAAETERFAGALWLTFGKDTSGNDTVEFLWRFDYYWEFTEPDPTARGKDKKGGQTVLEIFQLTSDELLWQEDGTVSGDFTVTLFTKTGEEGISSHFWDLIGTSYLTFNLSITPPQI